MKFALMGAVAMATLGAAPAFAQGAADDDTAKTVDELVVTANRREQKVLDVPAAVTALTGEALTSQHKDSIADYIRTVPGVNFKALSGGLNTITIRGVSGGFQRAKAPVSFYIDDIPVVSDPSATPDLKTFDIERVEVLRGPQGTLYGESSIGGVIRVISKKPDLNTLSGDVRVGYEDFSRGDGAYTIDGAVNVPVIADQFALRLSLSRREGGGYIDNTALNRKDQNDDDHTQARLTGLWRVNENLDISATGIIVRSTVGAYPVSNANYVQARFVDESRDDDLDQLNFTVRYNLGFAELVSSSNYYKRNTSRLFDLTGGTGAFVVSQLAANGTPVNFANFSQFWQTLNVNDKSYAQEFRLVSSAEGPLRWIAGAYFFKTDNYVNVEFRGVPAVAFTILDLRRFENYDQKAFFGEVEYDILPQLTVIAGARYTDENRDTRYVQADSWVRVRPFLPATGTLTLNSDYNIVTPRVAVRFKPTETTQIYASATRGFRGPGGNTQFSGRPGEANDAFDAETLWSYEAGAKGVFLDGRLSGEISIFRSDWKDRQETANPTAPITQQFVDNIGDAKLKGLEIAADLRLTDWLTLGGNYSFLDTEVVASANRALIGTELLNQPRERGSAYIDLHGPIMDDWRWNVRADMTTQSREKASQTTFRKGYTLLNMSAGLRNDTWGVSVFGRNLGNQNYEYFASLLGTPRVVGVTLDYSF